MNTGIEKKYLVNLALTGALLGGLNALGFTQNFEWALWAASWFAAGWLLSRRLNSGLFFNAFLAGFLFSLCVYIIQYLLFDLYVENNPLVKAQVEGAAPGLNPKLYLFSLGLLVSVGNGGITVLVSTALKHFFIRKQPVP